MWCIRLLISTAILVMLASPLFAAESDTGLVGNTRSFSKQHIISNGTGLQVQGILNSVLSRDEEDGDESGALANQPLIDPAPMIWTNPSSGSFGIMTSVSF